MVAIYVHGGVSGIEKAHVDLSAAVEAGLGAGSALDMIEAAVRVLEDDPLLNAGYGAVLDMQGNVSLDAGIADGTTGSTGAVAGVLVANPISLARRVLSDTPHALIIGEGAEELGRDLPRAEIAPERKAEWEKARNEGKLDLSRYGHPEKVDTVGAVALDDDGHLAAGSSTGGVFGKLPGRVGDSPIFGAGFYASKEAAVVGTGVGELFIETLASARVGRLIEHGAEPQAACETVLEFMGARGDTSAGLVALDAGGNFGAAFRGGTLTIYGPDGRLDPRQVK